MKNHAGRSARFKIGGSSLLGMLVVLVVAASLILLADALEQKHALRQDLSFNSATSQSRETQRVLSGLSSDVHIYALFTPGQEDRSLIGLLERYAAATPHITFSLENLIQNPALISSISASLNDGEVTSDCLIIHGKQADRIRILDGADYVTQSYDPQTGGYFVSGLTYEQSLTEAIAYVTADSLPALQVLTGHGELDETRMAAMEKVLTDYNFSMRRVDLLRGDALHPDEPLLILSPQKDLTADQVLAIDTFAKAGGALFITVDFNTQAETPQFDALYRSYGFVRKPGLVVAEEAEVESYYSSPAMLMPYMETTEPTAGLVAGKQTTLILAGAAAFEQPVQTDRLAVHVVLKSGNAYLRNVQDGADNIAKQPTDPTGVYPLALTAERVFDDGERSKAFIIGNSSVFTDSWLYQNTYSAEFLLSIMGYLTPGEPIQLHIAPRDAVRQPMRVEAQWLNQLILVLLPLFVALVGALVTVSRKKL